MHPPEVRAQALELVAAGLNDCEISRRIGIPRGTIRDWRRPTYVPREPASPRETCPRCWRAAKPIRFTDEDYAELLGLYLGDGCISRGARTYRLRITLDARYPKIIEKTRELVERCFPRNGIDVVRRGTTGNCVNVSIYSNHLPCVFPQHGAGKKHERRISLEPWQTRRVKAAPLAFLRGCIRSDGSSFINRTGPYEYLSYEFSNRSADIVELFAGACLLAQIDFRVTRRRGLWQVRINRRASVACLVEHVGVKS